MRIAWFVPGGISEEGPEEHNPVLTDLAVRMAGSVDLTVFAFSRRTEAGVRRFANMTIHEVPAGVGSHPLRRLAALIPAWRSAHSAGRFDLIHAFWALPGGVHAAAIGTAYRVPSLVTFPGGDTASIPAIGYGNLRSVRGRMLTRFVCSTASSIHLLTSYQRSQLEELGIHPRDVAVRPIGVDPGMFYGRPGTPAPPFKLLHVSNLTEVKDQVTLLSAFAALSRSTPVTLRIIGPDMMNGALSDHARRLGISDRIDFMGYVPRKDLPEQYRWADLYLHTSLHEGQSVSVVEAMAAGTPVCGTRVGIVADLPDGCVARVAPGDADALAESARSILADPVRYRDQSEAAWQWTQRNTVDETCGHLVAWYHRLTTGTVA